DRKFCYIFISFFFLLIFSGCLLRILTISSRINPFFNLIKKTENQEMLNKTKKISNCYIMGSLIYSLFLILAKYFGMPAG
ncbi:MAG: hypothetical protein LBF88_01235, partial [Planctomycetaceae bacterium]|nr:hypothetical protein [Planctomycetaceae bacterium]